MDEARLSAHERRVLAEIEEELDRDASLARRLRTMRPDPHRFGPPIAGARRHLPSLGVAALGATTLALLVLAVVTEAPVLIWAFGIVWVLTLVGMLLLVVRRLRRRAAPSRTDE
ncbi:DUF3040 domain-containing protein [Streptomyces tanashiensis]|uniref:DUF3040 domain-containing protein n=1 Tax=Streptomyces tanashiensis TaxID=67367 RepID=A0ABY6QS58_9ACTN|nr:DUF3040 domain-containing protein [Streptomyces tanashiensis]UZX20462.1 DUF3040 domain-containing protein [Streptomyces tanashiensis]GGY46958.1 hypothetical protein GCM10010299_61400 [Streptomyces tanashiensis]